MIDKIAKLNLMLLQKFMFEEIERKYNLHAGELEQWLGRAVITGDHSHRVVVVANGKFVGVGMPG